MKKIVFGMLILLLPVVLFSFYSPSYLINAPDMLVGFSAKTGCSLHYIVGRSTENTKKDIATYSPLFNLVKLDFDKRSQSLTTSFLAKKITAQYREGIGCTLDTGDTSFLDRITTDFSFYSFEPAVEYSPQLNRTLAKRIEQDNTLGFDSRAIIVKQKGIIIAEAYQSDYNVDTRFLGWSMSKTFTGLLIGNLVYRKNLNIDSDSIFKEWSNDDRQSISLTSLLTMTSGLEFEEVYEPGADATKMLFSDQQASYRSKQASLTYRPLQHWSYSSGTTNLLSELAFNFLGGTSDKFLQYVGNNLLRPMKLGSAILELDPSGVFVGSSFMYATARDWALLGEVYLGDGSIHGERIVTEQWIKDALTPNTSNNEPRYGYQLWLNVDRQGLNPRWPSAPPGTFAAKGNKGQLIIGIPEHDLVIVRLGWSKKTYNTDALIKTVLGNL